MSSSKTQQYLNADEQEENKEGKGWSSFFHLLSLTKSQHFSLLIGMCLIVLSTLASAGVAEVIGILSERVMKWKDSVGNNKVLIGPLGLFFLLQISHWLLRWYGKSKLMTTSSFMISLIREKIFSHLDSLPMKVIDKTPLGRILMRCTHDVESLEDFFQNTLTNLLYSFIMVVVTAIFLILTDHFIGTVMVCCALPSLFFMHMTKWRVNDINRDMGVRSADVNATLAELTSGLEVIKDYNRQKWASSRYQEKVKNYRFSFLEANRFYSWSRPSLSWLTTLPLFFLCLYLGRDVLGGLYPVATFVTLLRLADGFYSPLLEISREIHLLQQALTSSERLVLFLNIPGEVSLWGEGERKEDLDLRPKEGLIFRDVEMSYESNRVLQKLSFHAKAGEKIGIVGRTGSGKSSLISLLSRLYDYQSGEIFYQGLELKSWPRDLLRRKVSPVTQDVYVFSGSLRENLLAPEKSDEECISILREVGLWEILLRKGMTLDYILSDSCFELSAGEQQLLSLARILLQNPDLLILDEATSFIDQHHSELIQQALEKCTKGKMTMTIAHRLETLKNCDRIFHIDQGELIHIYSREQFFEKYQAFVRQDRTLEEVLS
jgi:ATP-binding cassette, subfamily B, multidrug efflux pump